MGVNAMFIGMTGLDTFGDALSIVSDNVANANTTAYKSGDARFGDLVSGYLATDYADTRYLGAGTTLVGVSTDFGTGSTNHTGTWSDVMIQGNGFFNVQDSNGTVFYTRDGTFGVDANGYLTDVRGYQVIGSDGNPVQIEADPANPAYIQYDIDSFGQIYGTPTGGGTKTLIGTLRISTFPNTEGLVRNGNNTYYPGASAGTVVDGTAGSGPAGEIVSGAIEGSNVDLTKQMVNMIIYQADYTANSKSIDTANTMLQTVVNLVR